MICEIISESILAFALLILWQHVFHPKDKKREESIPDHFEPEMCHSLPLHAWMWFWNDEHTKCFFYCPVCTTGQKNTKTPPYCSERGGHFHFKCDDCGYEWAMRTANYKEPKVDTATAQASDQIVYLRNMVVKATKGQLSEDLVSALTEIIELGREKRERSK